MTGETSPSVLHSWATSSALPGLITDSVADHERCPESCRDWLQSLVLVVVVVPETVAAGAWLGTASWAKTAYEYWVPGASPLSVKVVLGAASSTTRVPALGDAGAVLPTARRIIAPA